MAKVRRFKDRRKTKEVPACDGSQKLPAPAQQTHVPEESPEPLPTREKDDQDVEVMTGEPIQEDVLDPVSSQPSQPCPYPINVPRVEELMTLVHEGADSRELYMSALTASSQERYHTYRSPFQSYIHPVTGLPFFGRTPGYLLHSNTPPPPTPVELAGYSGLEDLPILKRMMRHEELDQMYTFYFRYNDTNCPAAVLLVDPLPGNSRYAKYERNCRNSGHEAWLYVRKRGDVKWTRDWMAERGGMRQAVHLSRCEEGWMWEQQLGDLLDCRKSLNLWIQVKA